MRQFIIMIVLAAVAALSIYTWIVKPIIHTIEQRQERLERFLNAPNP